MSRDTDAIMFEDVREKILELLSKDPVVQTMARVEFDKRFPGHPVTNPGMEKKHDEIVCMCSLLVYDRVLKGIIK